MSVVIVEEEAVAAEQSIAAEAEAEGFTVKVGSRTLNLKPKAKSEPQSRSEPPSKADQAEDEIEIPTWIKKLKQSPAASALERLYAQQAKVKRLSVEVERTSKIAKAAKSKLETQQDVLSQIFEELSITPEEWLPFGDDKDEDDSEDIEIDAEDIEAVTWLRYRAVTLDSLESVTKRARNAFANKGIATLGMLDDYLRSGERLAYIEGIGEATEEKLLDEKITVYQRIHNEVKAELSGQAGRQAEAARN